MPATFDTKNIASGWTDDEDNWGALMNANLRQLSAYVMNGFAQDVATTTGLTYGYRGGVGLVGASLVNINPGTVIVPASSTVYVVRTVAGVVSATTNPSFADRIHMATLVTNVGSIISVTDARYPQDFTQDGTITGVAFSTSQTPATAGAVRLGSAQSIVSRNAANTGNLAVIKTDSSDRVVIGDNAGITTLVSGDLTSPSVVSGAVVRASGGAGSIELKPGTLDHCYIEFFPRTAAANTRHGLFGYATGASDDIELNNDIGDILFNTADVQLALIGNEVVTNGEFTAVQFNGSGAGLATSTVPLASVVGLSAALGAVSGELAVLDGRADSLDGTVFAHDGRLDALELPRPFAAAISDDVPVARVEFGAALGYGTQVPLNVRGGVLADSVGNTNSELYTMCANLNNLVGHLINDLKARGVI